ncbi:MAG: SO2930 family diheme c-type cytochrome [Chitinophagaceae bacterium]
MKSFKILILLISIIVLSQSFRYNHKENGFEFHENLSAYNFFTGNLKELNPVAGILPYELNTPLFSNYAEKLRFIKLPANSKIAYNDSAVFSMPTGTVLIKNFFYYTDFRKPEKGRKIIETRLLVNREDGWATYQYIWNQEQTEAVFDPIGDAITVSYIDSKGKKITAPYIIPNQNQCKGCHAQGNTLLPIGLSARHLNGMVNYPEGAQNQLAYWAKNNMIDLPSTTIPSNANWLDKQASAESKARAYLDINCGFCHNSKGPANTSGLFLDIHNNNLTALGINKTPVAAGRGSGDLKYDIEPGNPHKSILIFRMTSTDPGISMPEIGREQIHKEGVALISEWIKGMSK